MTGGFGGFRGDQVLKANLGSLAPAIILVGLRFFTRARILRSLRLDDWFLLAALLCSVGDAIAMSFEIKGGLGRHIETLSESDLIQYAKGLWISILFYTTSLGLTKASILLGYLYVFPNPNIRIVSKCALGFLAVCAIIWTVSTCILCTPTARFWDRTIPGTCINPLPLFLANASLNITTDLIILCIPMPALASLKLPQKTKMWLVVVFGLGFFVTAASILRIPQLIAGFKSSDTTYDGTGAAIMSAIESNVAISCAALPPLRSFVKRYLPGLIGGSTKGSNSAGPSDLSRPRQTTHENTSQSKMVEISSIELV